MKNVAATRGQSVRRDDFFRWDGGTTTGAGWKTLWLVALAADNFYGFLLKRLTLTTSAHDLSYRGSRLPAISGHCGEVSSH